ncbi:hypothetical protein ACOMHN_005917 [Nucella lapillus]
MAKSKVAPIRPVTVQRLELQAAVLSVKIVQFLQEEFEGLNAQHHFWSDSNIVLGYLYNKTKKFHTFVANRVQQILDFSEPQQWHHVPSKDNPADHDSRSLSVTEIKDSNWHSGPEFLKHDPVVYEVPEVAVASDDTEVKVYPTKVKDEKGGDCEEIIKRFLSLDRLLRVAARLLSWLRQARKKRTKQEILVPSSSESQDLAFKQIIIGVRAQHFPLSQRSTHHELRQLDVFTDHQGILRVGGRLQHSSEAYQVKHPIVLPKDSHLSLLMARHHHAKVAHLGRTTTMGSLLSNGIWIKQCQKGGKFRSQDMYSQKRWRGVQFLVEQFWSRWKGEYLASLQPRRKWFHQRDSLKENAVVLLVDESAPRGSLKLARVVRVYPGHDRLARSVQIRLATTDRDRKGKLTVRSTLVDRPIHKLVPLPVCDN